MEAFSGKDGTLLTSFPAYGSGYQSGVTVAAGSWPGAGHVYVVTGSGLDAPAEVKTFDPQTGKPVPGAIGDFRPYGPGFRGGVYVGTGDVNGDGTSDVVTGPGAGHAPEVKLWDGRDGSLLRGYLAGGPSDRGGVRVASTYIDADGKADVVTAGGPGRPPQVVNYADATARPLPPPAGGFAADDPSDRTGLFVAAAIDPTVTVTITPAVQHLLVGGTASVTVAWSTDVPNITGCTGEVYWGDGSQVAFSFSTAPGSHGFSHGYTAAGAYTVTATVQVSGPGGNASGSGTATVVVTVPPRAYVPFDSCSCSDPGAGVVSNAPGLAGPTPADYSDAPVRYADGTVQLGAADLSSTGFGVPWGQSRSWSNGPGYAAGGDNGGGWVDAQAPHLLQADGSTNTTLIVVTDGTTARYYDLVNGSYVPRFFDQSQLAANTTTHEFVLTDTNGNVLHFADFSGSYPAAQWGALKQFVDPDGNGTSVTSWTMAGLPAEVQRTTTSGGTTVTESYLYAYVGGGGAAGLLSGVTLRRQVNGGAWSTVRQAQYTYYDGVLAHGNQGDLMLAQVLDGAGNVLDTNYYRYYTGEAGGYAGGLKYQFGAQSYARLVAALGSRVGSLSDAQVAPYADHYFEYDAQQRVTKEIAQGLGCSSCSGGLGTFTYAYTTSSNAAGMNSWATKCVETLPDGNVNTVYTNAYGEAMLRAYTDTTAHQTWLWFNDYDGSGQVILQANPSAVTGYNDTYADLLHNQSGTYQYLSSNSGLIQLADYYTSTTATSTTAGGVSGYVQDSKLEQGQAGTPILQSSTQYFVETAGGATIYPTATQTVYRNTDGTGAETTSFSYTWFTGTDQMQSETVTKPVISAAENGPAVADTEVTYFDTYARPIWHKDGDGFLTYTAYDPATGAEVKTITDVDTTRTGDFQNLPSGWSTPAGGGLHLITTMQVDGLGRTTEQTDPAGHITYTVYNDPNYEVLVYPGWNSSTNTPTGPTQVSREDRPGSYTETFTMSAAPHLTGGMPDGTEAVSGLQTLSRSYTNAAGQVVRQDDYFNLSGVTYSTAQFIGTQNTNYYTTQFGYDDRGRQDHVQHPTGTIDDTVFDGLGRVLSTWVGTNDTPASGEWSPSNNTSPANMVQTTADVYDGGGVGDGNLTQETQYPGGTAAPRMTQNWDDWRDRLVATKQGVQTTEDTTTHRPITYTTLDNLGEATTQQQYDGDAVTLTVSGGVPQAPSASLLRAQSAAAYDEQGRVYQTQVFDVNQSTGAVSSTALTGNTYFNHRGLQVAASAPGGLWTKEQYDGAGRATVQYTTDGAGGTTWAAADSVTSDNVLSQVETTYDADGGSIETVDRERFHNETTTGALGNPTTAPKARVSYAAAYYDLAERPTVTVNVGTNGGTAWTRPSTVPAASDTVLVTTQQYNPAGWVSDVFDPRSIDTHTVYDALGRTTQTVEDYTNGTPTSNTNKTTDYSYDGDGNQLTVTAVEPGSQAETTQYVYGVTTSGGSDVNSNDVLSAVQYPDPATGQASSLYQESYTVNALGQNKTYTDRNGTVHTYAYDVLGRQTADAVTTLAVGVDGTVLRLQTAYDTGGRPYLFTSFNAASGGSIVNQVEDLFNGLGQLTTEYQSHSGAVNPSSTPSVQYAYVDLAGGANNSRQTSMTYPNGRVVNYVYNAGLDSSISRLSALSDSSATLESYLYLGLNTVVQRSHPQPGVNLSYIQQTGDTHANTDGGDQYTGLDRFGRVIDQFWVNAGTGQATDRFQYGYDRDGNVLYKANLVGAAFSELYHASGAGNGYDQLNQLTAFERGTLSASQQGGPLDTVASPSHSQSWVYDALGNWSSVTTDGSTQNRVNNQQNEVTVAGTAALTFDKDGNTTTNDQGHSLVYDAWNHLVAVKTAVVGLTVYGYDALGRRITENPGALRDLYYSSAWQVLEERVGTDVQDQYLWSPVYVDALVERDRDQTGGGTLSERLYAQQDANWNVTAVLSTAGAMQERYADDPYGQVTYATPGWSVLTGTTVNWVYLHQGERQDTISGVNDSRGRVYIPSLGRWGQRDPLGYIDGPNLYEYEHDNTIVSVDPNGTDAEDPFLKPFGDQGQAASEALHKLGQRFYALCTSLKPGAEQWWPNPKIGDVEIGEGIPLDDTPFFLSFGIKREPLKGGCPTNCCHGRFGIKVSVDIQNFIKFLGKTKPGKAAKKLTPLEAGGESVTWYPIDTCKTDKGICLSLCKFTREWSGSLALAAKAAGIDVPAALGPAHR